MRWRGDVNSYMDEYPVLGPSQYRILSQNELYDGDGYLLDTSESDPTDSLGITTAAPPIAVADNNVGGNELGTLSPFVTPHGDSVVLDVLANDLDVNPVPYGPLAIHAITVQPQHGTVALNPDQTITYTADWDFAGTDTFAYVITDGHLLSGEAEVAVDVTNTAPVAQSTVVKYGEEAITLDVMGRPLLSAAGDLRFDRLHRSATDPGGLMATDADGDALVYLLGACRRTRRMR